MKKAGPMEELKENHKLKDSLLCKNCNKTCSTKKSLIRHEFLCFNSERFKCQVCEKQFLSKKHLTVHVRVHTGDKPFSCDFCYKSFNQVANLNAHRLVHTGEKPYTCKFCPKKFRQLSQLKAHERLHNGIKPFCCNLCDKSFSQKANLNAHILTHTSKRTFTCKVCDKSFSSLSSLSKHKNSHKAGNSHDRDQYFPCDICNKSLSLGSLKSHIMIHTGEKPYSCNKCDKSFRQQSHLNAHERVHLGVKPYSCDFCKKKFSQQSHLDYHKQTSYPLNENLFYVDPSVNLKRISPTSNKTNFVHNKQTNKAKKTEIEDKHTKLPVNQIKSLLTSTTNTESQCDKNFSCSCGESFYFKKYYNIHITTCNQIESNEESDCHPRKKSFEGWITSKDYETEANEVKVRSNVNNSDNSRENIQSINDKTFSCNLCNKKFTQKSTFTVHIRQHSKQTLFSCKFCSKGYKSYQALKYHLVKKHDYKWNTIYKKIKKTSEGDKEQDKDNLEQEPVTVSVNATDNNLNRFVDELLVDSDQEDDIKVLTDDGDNDFCEDNLSCSKPDVNFFPLENDKPLERLNLVDQTQEEFRQYTKSNCNMNPYENVEKDELSKKCQTNELEDDDSISLKVPEVTKPRRSITQMQDEEDCVIIEVETDNNIEVIDILESDEDNLQPPDILINASVDEALRFFST